MEAFDAVAKAIMYRWTAERDTRVSAAEVEQAREYLTRKGVWTTALAEGRFAVHGAVASVDAAHVVLLGLRHVVHARMVERSP